jgi:hypothetical protein
VVRNPGAAGLESVGLGCREAGSQGSWRSRV